MIHELDSIPSNKLKGSLRGYTKWKVFIRKRVGKGAISKRKRIFFMPRHRLFWNRGHLHRFSLRGAERDGSGSQVESLDLEKRGVPPEW